MIPNDCLYVSSFWKDTKWSYLRPIYQTSDLHVSEVSGFYQVSAGVDNVKHIFFYLQRATNNAAEYPYLVYTYQLNANNNNSYLTTCRLE